MTLKIDASNLVSRRYLMVESDGVKFCETSLAGGVRRFRFSEIVCILMSADHTLSFQVGGEVFTLQTKAESQKHQTVIATLVDQVERAAPHRAIAHEG